MTDEPLHPGHPDEQKTRYDDGSRGPSQPETTGGIQGKRLGDFELISELGRGGMGIVYEAHQISLNRRVALKVLPPGLSLTPEARIRFEREAHAAAKLHHTNIVPVHAFGEQDGYHFYAMDLVDGQPLSRILDDLRGGHANLLLDETLTARPGKRDETGENTRSPASTSGATTTGGREWFDTVARLVADVAEALDYAHGRGVIHRDVKPANLLFSLDGRLSIADFGLARVAQEPGMTVSGSLLGSPAYMSPEQIAAGRMKLDHRTDVYSLGAVLYEMLTLQHPFPGETREEVFTGILTKEPRAPRRVNPKVPTDLETICQKAMEKDPDRRYQSAGLFAQDLRRYLERGLITARRAGPVTRTVKWVRRHPVASAVAAGAVVVAILGIAVVQQRSGRSEESARGLVGDAELHLREGTYRQGLARVNEALALTPDSLDAKRTKARLLFELRHDRELANLAKEILATHPNDWEAHAWLASAGRYALQTYDSWSQWLESAGLADIPADEHRNAVERLAPDTAQAWRLKGSIAESSIEAVKCFDRALDLDAAHYWALIGRAEAYIKLKRFPEAIVDAGSAIVARPVSPRGRSLLAEVYGSGLHDVERALAEYARAIAIDPDEPITYLQRGGLYESLANYEKFLEDTTKGVELEQKNPSSYLSIVLAARASALFSLGRFEEALSDARRSVEIEPHRITGYLQLPETLRRLNKRDEADATMEDLFRLSERWPDRKYKARVSRWTARNKSIFSEHEQALAAANRSIELEPGELSSLAALLLVQQLQGGQAAGEHACDLITQLQPTEPYQFFQRGIYLGFASWCDRVEGGLADFTRAIAMAPAWADAFQYRGDLLLQEHRYDEALADYAKAIELAPKWADGFRSRASAHEDLEQWPLVLDDLQRYFTLGGMEEEARRSQATALARLGREPEAIALLDKAVQGAPKRGAVYLNRADLLFHLGRLDDALASIDKVLELKPTNHWRYWTRARYLAFKPGSCARADADLATYRELATPGPWVKGSEAAIRMFPLGFVCPELAQPARSLEFVRESARAFPKSSQDELGAAFYVNGRYEEAKVALLKSLDSQAMPDPIELFFLAMTESKLGRQADARRTYDRAVSRMNETWPKSPDLVLLKREAGKLVGTR